MQLIETAQFTISRELYRCLHHLVGNLSEIGLYGGCHDLF